MTLRFRRDGTFTVLQMTDIQDGPDVNDDTIALIRAAIAKADPDLAVFTGDQIRGYDPAYMYTFRRRRDDACGDHVRPITRVESVLYGHPDVMDPDRALDHARGCVADTLSRFLAPLVDAHVPFAVTYGNHDFQCGVPIAEQDDLYRRFPGCLNPDAIDDATPLTLAPGTFTLPVLSSDASVTAMAVTLVDSGDYIDATTSCPTSPDRRSASPIARVVRRIVDRISSIDLADSSGYGLPSPRALDWLGAVQRRLAAEAGHPVPSIVFQHIPTQEFYDCLREVPPSTANAVEGKRTHAGRCYALDRRVCRPGSVLGEGISCPDTNCGEVDVLRDAGGYFALFAGHDHKNAFVGHADGLDLGYSPTCGFGCYGPRTALRGIRMFTFHEDDPAAYDTRVLTYGELLGHRCGNELYTFVGDHLIVDGVSARDQLRRPHVRVAAAALAIAFIAHLLRHRRHRAG